MDATQKINSHDPMLW